jgi:hypothetical protein
VFTAVKTSALIQAFTMLENYNMDILRFTQVIRAMKTVREAKVLK